NMCWRWPQAPLDGVKRVALTVERVAWRFGDEAANAVVRPRSGAGQLDIHVDTCAGALLASVPLAAAAGENQVTPDRVAPASPGAHDVCVIASGDPRDGQWALARMTFSRGDARRAITTGHAKRGFLRA